MEQRLLLTRRFVFLTGTAWLLFAAAVLTRSETSLALALTTGFLVFIGSFLPRRPNLQAIQSLDPASPTESEPVQIQIELSNRSHRTVFGEWSARLPGLCRVEEGHSFGLVYLPRGRNQTSSFKTTFQLFGRQRLEPVRFRAIDPFGFLVQELDLGAPVDTRVKPRVDRVREEPLVSRQKRPLIGLFNVPRAGVGFEFFGLRSYSVGDRPRDVNWKATGRVGSLVVNQKEWESNAEVVIIADCRRVTRVGPAASSAFARGLRLALGISNEYLGRRNVVRFVTYGQDVRIIPIDRSAASMDPLVEHVMDLVPVGALKLRDAVQKCTSVLKPRSPTFILTSLVGDDTVEEALSILQSRNLSALIVVPMPDWPNPPPPEAKEWATKQEENAARLRLQGFPTVLLEPGIPFETAIANEGVPR